MADEAQFQPIVPTGNIAGALMITLAETPENGVMICIGRASVPMDRWIMCCFGQADSARHDAMGFMARFVAANMP